MKEIEVTIELMNSFDALNNFAFNQAGWRENLIGFILPGCYMGLESDAVALWN
jgi:hypothetical protein